MTRPITRTPEQKRATLAKAQKKYYEKIRFYYNDYPNLEKCYNFACKCLRRSIIFNSILLVTTVLGWIL